MSISDSAPDATKPGPKQAVRNARDQKELACLDAIFNRIKRAVPPTPYILSVDSLNPVYQPRSRQEAHSWIVGHLFEPHEENIQYRTFCYREPYEECFTMQNGEDIIPDRDRTKARSSFSTPSGVPKKKITLSAYKAKQSNGVITPGKKVSPDLVPTKPSLAHVNGAKKNGKATDSPSLLQLDGPHSEKRKLGTLSTPEPSGPPEESSRETLRPLKKPRTESLSGPKPTIDTSASSNGTPHGLPPLLSPVGPSLPDRYDLPPLLSPTLPSNVQFELDRLDRAEAQRERADSNTSTSSSDKKPQPLSAPEPKSHRKDDDSTTNSHTSSKARKAPVQNKSPDAQPASLQREIEPLIPAEDSLILRLKFSKKSARSLEQLLKLPASRKPISHAQKKERQENRKEGAPKPQPRTFGSETSKNKDVNKVTARRVDELASAVRTERVSGLKGPEKRVRGEDDTPSSKRQKTSAAQDRPTTPAEQLVSSPALPNKSSAQKLQAAYITPRKELKSINMLRTSSAEGYETTPGRGVATPSSGLKKTNGKPAPTSTAVNAAKGADVEAIGRTSKKLNELGRSLKHECTKLGQNRKQMSDVDAKRVAITGLECILTYVASFYLTDVQWTIQGRPGAGPNNWVTLMPLLGSYWNCCKNFAHLEGLRLHLLTVITSVVCGILSKSRSGAHDSPQDQPRIDAAKTLWTDVARTLGIDAARSPLEIISEQVISLHRFATDARMALSVDDIMKHYPKTWTGRETVVKSAKDQDKIKMGKLAGPYCLPIAADTPPIQLVRFGYKFLKEYAAKEGVKYDFRLDSEMLE
ncbi:hypothetical protein GQ43DRAFT_475535 [Delitschia confertaspora ATCC 74209]|uniref:Uncharacterized protein n=1 Tax=Delitschia confertaspora ATCC 74209 TaxID=1513339 RepID=A0A9P4MRU0_9PLEO|nr:hypothetical protein GQ43DRAFT_475535 [Delitschia confertaspora ATCC 74209]